MKKTTDIFVTLGLASVVVFLLGVYHLDYKESLVDSFTFDSDAAQDNGYNFKSKRMVAEARDHKPRNVSCEIRILSWTTKFLFKKAWWNPGEEDFRECGLPPHMKCRYTDDPREYNTSDVILFRVKTLKNKAYLPRHRSAHQKWIFYESEPPPETWPSVPDLDQDAIRSLFNLTSTFAQDSSVPIRLPLRCTRDKALYEQLGDVDYAASKTRNVAWFVSHCETSSKREDYVSVLKQFIDVDVYGACGNLSCVDKKTPLWGTLNQTNQHHETDCDKTILNTTYRFYLSFENSLCEDYVTEKLTRLVLDPINVIPVVMGLGNYSDHLPADSYINVRDFSHPRHLAAYLKRIANNRHVYNEFVRNKNSLKCRDPYLTEPYQCRLCRYLHGHRHERQTVDDVVSYWSEPNKCHTPQQFLNRK